MLARAVASASGRNFISIKGSELFSKWSGFGKGGERCRARSNVGAVGDFHDEVDG